MFNISSGETGTKNAETQNVELSLNFVLFRGEMRSKRSESEGNSEFGNETVVRKKTARTAIETACKTAKLPKIDHHCMRHYFASNALEYGIDFKTVAVSLGHKDCGLLVAKTYGNLRDTHLFEMAKK